MRDAILIGLLALRRHVTITSALWLTHSKIIFPDLFPTYESCKSLMCGTGTRNGKTALSDVLDEHIHKRKMEPIRRVHQKAM